MTLHSDLLRIDPAAAPLFVGRVSEAGEAEVLGASGLRVSVAGAIAHGVLMPDGERIHLHDDGFFEVLSYVMPHDVLVTSLHDDRECPHLGAWLLSRRDTAKESDDRQMIDASAAVHAMLDRSRAEFGSHFLMESFGQWAIKVTDGHLSVSSGKRQSLILNSGPLEPLVKEAAEGAEPFLMVCWWGSTKAKVRPKSKAPSIASLRTTGSGHTFLEIDREFFTGLERRDIAARLGDMIPDVHELAELSGFRVCLKNDRQRGLAWATLSWLLARLDPDPPSAIDRSAVPNVG